MRLNLLRLIHLLLVASNYLINMIRDLLKLTLQRPLMPNIWSSSRFKQAATTNLKPKPQLSKLKKFKITDSGNALKINLESKTLH